MAYWTDGRIKGFITSTLRSGFRRWPSKYECLNAAKVGKKLNIKTNRLAEHYKCASCKGEFTNKDVEVDHINPVVDPVEGFTTWDNFIKRLYVSNKSLQVLCKKCHKIKTKEERKQR